MPLAETASIVQTLSVSWLQTNRTLSLVLSLAFLVLRAIYMRLATLFVIPLSYSSPASPSERLDRLRDRIAELCSHRDSFGQRT
ncbi:MAG: hypothetical protein CL908_26700 [Deltaproteobacteria bacterium]|nr:hypothetical protein [Deltaproteobacteria bacterium]